MSEFLTTYREKNPQYNDLNDDQLVTALHGKYNADTGGNVSIEEFRSAVGYSPKPKDTALSATRKSLANVPERFQQSVAGLVQMTSEELIPEKERHIALTAKRLGVTPNDYKLLAWAGKAGLVDIDTPVPEALEDIKRNVVGSLGEEELRQVAEVGLINPQEIARFSKDWRERLQSEMEPIDVESGTLPYYTSAVIGSTAEMMPALMAGAITRNPNITMGIMTGQVTGQKYAEAKEKGATDEDAQLYALSSAASEVIPEALPLGILLKQGLSLPKRMLGVGVAEGIQETVTEAINIGLDMEILDEEMTLGDAMVRLRDAGVIGAASGPVMAAAVQPVQYAQEKIAGSPTRQLKQELEGADYSPDAQPEIDLAAIEALNPEVAQIKQKLPEEKSIAEMVKEKRFDKQITEQPSLIEGFQATIEDPETYQPESEPVVTDDTTTEATLEGMPIYETSLDEVTLSKDVPQFKSGADKAGVVEPLGGEFDRTGVAPVQIWVREDGRKEVITGRHRLDLARRSGEKTIPAQYHYESEGFTAEDAGALDALLNIREGQGKVKDYVNYIQKSVPTEQEAEAEGILARKTGKQAFSIASKGSEPLISAHANDKITDEGAARIAEAAPNNDSLQAVGLKALLDGKSISLAENLTRAVMEMTGGQQSTDMFGFDESAMKEAEAMAKAAVSKQRDIQKRITAVKGASKNPELAAKEGVDVKNPEALREKIAQLEEEKRSWNDWHTDPKKVAELRATSTPDKPILDKPETEAERQEREQAQQEAQKAEAEKAKKADQKQQADKEAEDFVLTGSELDADQAAARGQEDIFSQPEAKPGREQPKEMSLTESDINGLNYTNGIEEVAKNLNIPVTPNEFAGSIRDKIKKAVLGESKSIPESTYKNYKKDNSKPQLHGTSAKIGNMEEYTYSSLNIYGQGLYTTDSLDIAKGYSAKGKGKEPTIYQVELTRKPKMLDMEAPIDKETGNFLRSMDSDVISEALLESSTLREVYDNARGISQSFNVSADILQESFDSIADHLMGRGFDGIRHVGGVFTKQNPHNVEIFFNPKEILKLNELGAKKEIDKKPKRIKARPKVERRAFESFSRLLEKGKERGVEEFRPADESEFIKGYEAGYTGKDKESETGVYEDAYFLGRQQSAEDNNLAELAEAFHEKLKEQERNTGKRPAHF